MVAKKYEKKDPVSSSVSDVAVSYGNIDTLKVQLVNRIMRMSESDKVKSVLDFVNEQSCTSDRFEEEWKQSLTPDEFSTVCKDKLKVIYGSH